MKKITFIGLGVMGFPMAGHLSKEGFNVTVYNRSEEKSKLWIKNYIGTYSTSIKEAVSDSDIGYEVHICGDGPMMEELQALAKESKTKIVFHGWINNKSEKYKNLLESAAIYSLVSAKENASKSLLEALSAGCAVITSNIAGCPESVGDAGITIEPENAEKLKNVLYRLANDESEIARLGKKGRERILTKYNWDTLIQQYEAVLKNIIS